jgi:hypothetical protein
MIRTCLIVGAAVLASGAPENAFAQSSSLFNNSGSRSTGSGSSGGSLTTQSSAGGLQGSSGLGSAGGRGAGGAGSGSAFDGPQIGEVGDLSSQSVGRTGGFVGQSNQGTFVGNRIAGTGGMSAMQPSFGALGGGRGGSDFNSQNGRQQGSSQSRSFRPRYRIGFEYKPVLADVSQRAAVQVNRLQARNPALADLQINVDDAGVAEIRGQATTDDARLLIENLVRLEPGVRSVTNLVQVTPTPPSAANP